MPRHRHDEGFIAVVLAGRYVEAGDTGRHRAEAGDVLLHRPFERHLDHIEACGAEVLVLPLGAHWDGPVHGKIADPDAVVRVAQDDPAAAARAVMADLAPKPAAPADWPDLLAQALCANPSLSLSDWSQAAGLHPASLSRGFRQVFGVTPLAYRLAQRTHRAIAALVRTPAPLSAIAHDCGFTDQAHMSRAVLQAAAATPGALRRGRR
jgi:AraC-like DNA-binding protein